MARKNPGWQFSSVQMLSRAQLLQPHGLQHARLPCPPPTPGASANSCFATFGNFDWGKINLSKIFQLLNDDVLLHVLVVGEQEKKNLEHEVCISLYLGVFSCATVYKLMHSL